MLLYAVDLDPALLQAAGTAPEALVVPVRGDLLESLAPVGGPRRGD